MRTLHAILLLIGALAVLGLGAASASAGATGRQPPCHAGAMPAGHPVPAPAHDDAMRAMSCCVACVAVPDSSPIVRCAVPATAPAPQSPILILPVGRSPAPEPGPPRVVIA